MPRLLGVDIPGKKKIEYSLRYIYGIGPARSREIVEMLKLAKGVEGLVRAWAGPEQAALGEGALSFAVYQAAASSLPSCSLAPIDSRSRPGRSSFVRGLPSG